MNRYFVNRRYRQCIYVALVVTTAFGLVGAYFLDTVMLTHGMFSFSMKLFYVSALLFYVALRSEWRMMCRKIKWLWLVLACVPSFLIVLGGVGRFSDKMDWTVAVWDISNILVTVLWEELFFRHVGRTVFEVEGKYSYFDVIILVLLFMAPHGLNILFQSADATFLQMCLAFSTGVLWLAIYRKTDNLLICFIAHLMENVLASVLSWFMADGTQPFVGYTVSVCCYVAVIVMGIVVGRYILVKNGYVVKKRTAC